MVPNGTQAPLGVARARPNPPTLLLVCSGWSMYLYNSYGLYFFWGTCVKLEGMLATVCILIGVFAPFLMKPVFAEAHDIALVGLSLSTNQTYEGLDVRIEVVTRNQGSVPETFNVTFYVNGTSELVNVDTYLVSSLGASSEIVIPFVWNTYEVNPGNYTMMANASVVEGELDIADNFIVGENMTVLEDDTSPVIDVPVQDPRGDVQEFSAVDVYVNVSDSESGVHLVLLSWRQNNETYWYNGTMTYDPSRGCYEYNIGNYGGGILISYKVIATDNAGNQEVRDNAGSYYTYSVIPEFQSTILLLIMMFFTLSTALILRKANSPK